MNIFLKKYMDAIVSFVYALVVWLWFSPVFYKVGMLIAAFWNYYSMRELKCIAILVAIVLIAILALFLLFLIVYKLYLFAKDMSLKRRMSRLCVGYVAGTLVSGIICVCRILLRRRNKFFDIYFRLIIPSVSGVVVTCIITFAIGLLWILFNFKISKKLEHSKILNKRYDLLLGISIFLFSLGIFALNNIVSFPFFDLIRKGI